MKYSTIFIFLILIFSPWSICVYEQPDKLVKARVHAKWAATSILAEISEYVADDNEENFWKFLDELSQDVDRKDDYYNSDLNLYEFGISTARKVIDSTEMGLLKFSLSVRMMSPRVEVHRKLAMKFNTNKCSSSFFVYGNQCGCRLSGLDISTYQDYNSNSEIYPFDHVYPVKSTAIQTIFLYGDIGSKEFANDILEAKILVETHKNTRLVVRHYADNNDYPKSKNSNNKSLVSLSGYGVELALKNTEYKSLDSSKSKVEDPENLFGFNFKTLKLKHTHKHKALDSLKEHLERITPLKKWQLTDLGYKTCEKMYAGMSIKSMEVLLQDFPLHATAISYQKLNETFRESVTAIQKKLNSKGIKNGENLLAINGKVVARDPTFINLFSFLETVKQEVKIADAIAKMGFVFNTTDIGLSDILSLIDFSPVVLSEYAFDYRHADPVYLNDLETKRTPFKSFNLLLQPFPPGVIRPIARNIFTLVVFVDPFNNTDNIFDTIQEYINSRVFIRFGFVPVFDENRLGMSLEEVVESKAIDSRKINIWSTKESLLNALKKGNAFFRRSGFSSPPIALLNGYPLDVASPEEIQNFDTNLAEKIAKQTTRLQLAVFHGFLDDSVDIEGWWLEKNTNPDIVERINQKIIAPFNEKKFVNFSSESVDASRKLHYITENSLNPSINEDVTTWIVGEFGNSRNEMFVEKIIKSINVKKQIKIAFIPNPKNMENEKLCNFEQKITGENSETKLRSEVNSSCTKNIPFTRYLAEIGLQPGCTFVISNGLIIGPLTDEDYLTVDDFDYLDDMWKQKEASKAVNILNKVFKEDVSMNFYSVMAKFYKNDMPTIDLVEFKDPKKRNMMTFPATDLASPAITITWIANPASREAQQIVSLVNILKQVTNSHLEIIFNPEAEMGELPVNRFYRFVANNELLFDDSGSIENNVATFANLPQKQLLTMSIETNDAWMVEVKQAKYDLDNILLDSVSESVDAVISLEHILFEGRSRKLNGEPSDGLEIGLTSGTKHYDTIVMMNLGYFQLKAEPGIWSLRLRKGTSAEKYRMLKVDSEDTENESTIVICSFNGKWSELVVDEVVNAEDPKQSSIEKLLISAKNFFTAPDTDEVINVFSLASGHLYERFLRIMMVSVMKNTNNRNVKFWLLKNYLSPKFKKTIPHLADFYGFEYELVEYKWPTWLRRQTEKQRVMWGYKILFLDVLFPLSVDKIIFVDADQVVRADLQDLMDYNLKGAPYGYVPFCESRKETEGFRFWKSGYWKNHLMGRKYHISALYVVDLKAFRQLSAGDRLRGRYESLSADPNSLSNLDQDLPNNMIHEVPIRSLPQEWLWCETWCDDYSKNDAKTIDLCNNPSTKEPKLNAAKRIIGEWNDLDDEVTNVLNSYRQRSQSSETQKRTEL